jgi:quinol monooxygenase YgiN
MLIVHVEVHVKPDAVEAFEAATLENARASLAEPGILRFDVVRRTDDPTRFVLVEAYRDEAAPLAHKQTPHYAAWRDAVEPLMAEPRQSRKFTNVFPRESGWSTPHDAASVDP